MKNTYIVKRDNEISSFYYGENKSIYIQKLVGGHIVKNKVIENVLEYFSVSLDKKGQIYIFCQDEQNNVILATSLNDEFKISILLKKEFNMTDNTIFNPLFFGKNIGLIFNSQAENNRDNYISIKTLLNNKDWTKTENIDIFSTSNNNLFEIQKLNEKDAIIVYEKRDKDIQLGFKEITDGKISPFTTFHRTGYQIVDFSFLAINDVIHFIYVVKNLFSSQVLYRRKDKTGISNPIILYEGQKIKNCNIAYVNGILYCMYVSNLNLFYSISNDFGESFLGVSKHKKSFTQDTIKANFITSLNDENIYLNQIYVDYRNPLNIQFFDEICPDYISFSNFSEEYPKKMFYASNQNFNNNFISDLSSQNIVPQEEEIIEKPNIPKQNKPIILNNINKNYKTIATENDFMSHFDTSIFENMIKDKNLTINSFDAQINKFENVPQETPTQNNNQKIEDTTLIQNKLNTITEELHQKNNQISDLNNKLIQKNSSEENLKSQIEKLLKEINELKDNISQKDTTIKGDIIDNNETNTDKDLE